MHLGYGAWIHRLTPVRCPAVTDLEVHHLRYTKVRPNASLDDLQVLCGFHHRHVESKTPYRSARRRFLQSVEAGK